MNTNPDAVENLMKRPLTVVKQSHSMHCKIYLCANTSPLSTRARARAREAVGNQRPWPADKVERWAVERLIPYAKNARTHTDAQVAGEFLALVAPFDRFAPLPRG